MAELAVFSEITEAQGRVLLATAREAIASRLEGRSPRWPVAGSALSAELGAFVTLRSGKAPGAPLRGCIGRMDAKESLVRTIRAMALSAAFDDPRFPPLERGEYPKISLEITILTPMRQIGNISEIEVGRHGVYLSKGWHSAIFLPQVATEQGWGRDELLVNLCYKAGLSANAWKESDTKFQVFEGRIFEEG
jgi:AmmeMemoRadiSam system protein A